MENSFFQNTIFVEANLSDSDTIINDYIINIIKNKRPNEYRQYVDKIKNHQYHDLKIFSCHDNNLKKENVMEIIDDFSSQGHESINLKFYVIKGIEKATHGALNALLKFIEEGKDNIFGIFTTYDINNVFPTIVSRCHRIIIPYNPNMIEEIKNKYDLDDEQINCIKTIFHNSQYLYEQLDNNMFINMYNNIKNFSKTNIMQVKKIWDDFLEYSYSQIKLFIQIFSYFHQNNLNVYKLLDSINLNTNKTLIFNSLYSELKN